MSESTAVANYMESPQRSLVDALGMLMRDNASGVSVTHDSVMGIPACRRATQIVSGLVGRIPVNIVKHQDNLNKIDLNHPNQYVLRRPHKYYGWYTLARTLTANAMWFGNGYGLVIRDDVTTNVESIAILDSEKTYPILVDGSLRYKTEIGKDKVIVGPEDILHIKNLGCSGLYGWSVLDQLKDSLGLSLSLIKFSSYYFRNNASLGTVIEIPGTMRDKEEIEEYRNNVAELHVGVSNAHKLCLLQGGAKLVQLSVNQEQAQLLQSKQFDLLAISNITGVNPHLIGSPRNTSFNSLEAENQSFLDHCVSDWLSIWQEGLEQVLLTEYQKRIGSHSISFDLATFIKADTKTAHDIAMSKLNNGEITFNELRLSTNQDPVNEEWADWHRIPENTSYSELKASQEADTPDTADQSGSLLPTTEPDDLEPRYKALKEATMKRLHTRLKKSLDHSIQTRQDVDISSHVSVFIESGLGFTEATATEYIQDWIKGNL